MYTEYRPGRLSSFFYRWGRQHTQSFPSFRQPEDYYGYYVFPGSIKVLERPLSYHTQFDWNSRMFQGVGIHSKEKTHSARKQSVRHAELGGVSESQIRRAGRWNTDAMTGVYLSYLPQGFIRSIAGFPQEGKAYFLPRAQKTPEEALCTQVWPETDVWLQCREAYHPDRTDNEVIRLDLAGSGFLRLLRALRVVLLQDSVILRQRFASHPLWTDPLFNSEEYRRFAARVEDSLVDVVTPDELTMQKYWPAHDAVAKLRHEAAISEIKTSARESVSEIVRSIIDRLDTMERSSAAASFTPSIPSSRAARARMGPAGSGSGLPRLYDRLWPGLGLFRFPCRSSRDTLQRRRCRQTS
jgi:Centromere DNA-binding protein complex CBF3 subunit, domain 2